MTSSDDPDIAAAAIQRRHDVGNGDRTDERV